MRHKINYTAESKRDMDEIWDYVVSEFQNNSAADRIINKIMDDVGQLESFAELGPALSSIIDINSDYRFLVSGKYLVFYRVLDLEVRIERVMYGRRNYLSYLFNDMLEQE